MSASTSAHASPSLPLMLSMPIIFCSTRWIHPPEGRSLLPLTCFYRFYFFTVLFKLLSTTAEQQIPYGEHTQLLLQLMVLQSFKEGMVLGMPSKVLDYGSIFPSWNPSCSTSSSSQSPRLIRSPIKQGLLGRV